jgi:hypothetical protein
MVGILGTKFNMVVIWAATSINLGYIGEQSSSFSYTYGGDLNGDRGNQMICYSCLIKLVICVLFQLLKL